MKRLIFASLLLGLLEVIFSAELYNASIKEIHSDVNSSNPCVEVKFEKSGSTSSFAVDPNRDNHDVLISILLTAFTTGQTLDVFYSTSSSACGMDKLQYVKMKK